MTIADLVTRILTTIGDCSPIDYGGGYVYMRRDNAHTPENPIAEVEYIEVPIGHGPRDSWDCPACAGNGTGPCESPPLAHASAEYQAIRCHCETCDGFGEWQCVTCRGTGEDPDLRWTVYRVLVEACDWVNWHDVAASTGEDPTVYLDAFEQGERLAMARAIVDYAGHDGWYQLDQYPLSATRAEVMARVASLDAIGAR